MTDAQSWLTFSDPRFGLRCRYPGTTPLGKPVIIRESERPGMLRAHLVSQDSQEVYFEITCYFSLPVNAIFNAHVEELVNKFLFLVVTPLETAELASRPGYVYDFAWKEGARVAYLVESGPLVYRILYNPNLPLNLRILETTEWID